MPDDLVVTQDVGWTEEARAAALTAVCEEVEGG